MPHGSLGTRIPQSSDLSRQTTGRMCTGGDRKRLHQIRPDACQAEVGLFLILGAHVPQGHITSRGNGLPEGAAELLEHHLVNERLFQRTFIDCLSDEQQHELTTERS